MLAMYFWHHLDKEWSIKVIKQVLRGIWTISKYFMNCGGFLYLNYKSSLRIVCQLFLPCSLWSISRGPLRCLLWRWGTAEMAHVLCACYFNSRESPSADWHASWRLWGPQSNRSCSSFCCPFAIFLSSSSFFSHSFSLFLVLEGKLTVAEHSLSPFMCIILFNPQTTLIIMLPFLEIREQEVRGTCQVDTVSEPGRGPRALWSWSFCSLPWYPGPCQLSSPYPQGSFSPSAPQLSAVLLVLESWKNELVNENCGSGGLLFIFFK